MAPRGFKKTAAELFISSADTQQQEPAPADPAGAESFAVPKGYKLVKAPKSERLQLLISKQLKTDITEAAKARNLSVNELVNRIMEKYLESENNE